MNVFTILRKSLKCQTFVDISTISIIVKLLTFVAKIKPRKQSVTVDKCKA